jgi:ribonuclease inhibitor
MHSENEIHPVILDGDRMDSRDTTHLYLKEQLGFPDYYGRNLDALWDLLSTWSDPMEIRLIHSDALYHHLGAYAVQLISVFTDAQQENNKIRFEITHESDFFENVIMC